MDIQLIDSHAHLNDGHYREDLQQVLQRAQQGNIRAIINVAFDLKSSYGTVRIAEEYSFVHATAGIHPHDAARAQSGYLDELRTLAKAGKVVAIGEIGLDYYRNRSPAAAQKIVFREQLRLAKDVALPVIVHDREAHLDVYSILEEEQDSSLTGVLHCFSGDIALARRCLDLGFYISLAGPVTYKKTGVLADVARYVPLDRLLLETDAPYLTPTPHRGKRNEPAHLMFTAQHIAELRREKLSKLAEATCKNTENLFQLT
jgi:TatD DNase family protein